MLFYSRMKRKTNSSGESKPKQDSLKRGASLDVVITGMDEDGNGISQWEGRRLIVSGGLPGETVRVRVTHVGRRQDAAVVARVLRRSPSRLVSPNCANRECDGCPFIIMNYSSQLAWKGDFIAEQILRYPCLAKTVIHPVIPSPKQIHYRNSAKLVVAGKFAEPVIGIYKRNSHDVIELDNCPLHHPLINRVVAAVKAGIRKGKVPIYSSRTESGLLRYLVVRVSESTNKAMVVFVTSQRSFNEIHHLAKFLKGEVPEVAVIVQNVNASEGNVILGEKDHFLTREQSLSAAIGETVFSLSPRSFFQVNTGSAAVVYETARKWAGLTGRERVVDLYCGIGGISLFLSGKAQEVIGIEVVDAAVADAERNAALNKVHNCRFEAGDAGELLDELLEDGEQIDLVVLNPPRKGCERGVLERTAALEPDRIIYVSCSPVTLARDLQILDDLGYETSEIQPVDMFPQTPHVENVALLTIKQA